MSAKQLSNRSGKSYLRVWPSLF